MPLKSGTVTENETRHRLLLPASSLDVDSAYNGPPFLYRSTQCAKSALANNLEEG